MRYYKGMYIFKINQLPNGNVREDYIEFDNGDVYLVHYSNFEEIYRKLIYSDKEVD